MGYPQGGFQWELPPHVSVVLTNGGGSTRCPAKGVWNRRFQAFSLKSLPFREGSLRKFPERFLLCGDYQPSVSPVTASNRKAESETGTKDGGMSALTNIQMSPAQISLQGSVSVALARGAVETDIPARLDSLPWSSFHTRVIAALGITWILDGLEVTLAGALSGALKNSPVLNFSNTDIGIATSAYLAGAVLGAIGFGWLTDRIGRKKLFFVTLAVYLTATAATAFSWNLASFALFRFITGAGIGGEYTAINSTIQELVPARYRGRTDLIVNGSFWIGAAIGAVSAIVLLDPAVIDPELGWRLAF